MGGDVMGEDLNNPSDSHLKRGRGNRCLCGGWRFKTTPPAHVWSRGGEMDGWGLKTPPPTCIWSERGGIGGGVVVENFKTTPLTRIWSKGGEMDGWDLKHPLQLTFEAREGERWWCGGWGFKTTPPTHVWSEGGGKSGGVVVEDLKRTLRLVFVAREGEWWVDTWNNPSDSHLKWERGK